MINSYSNTQDENSISINDLRSVFITCSKKFENFGQHDAQEFLRLYIEQLGIELNKIKIIQNYQEFNTKNKNKLQLVDDYHNFFQKREKSIILDLFYGEYCNGFVCNCGYETFSFEKMLDIPILLSKFLFLIHFLST